MHIPLRSRWSWPVVLALFLFAPAQVLAQGATIQGTITTETGINLEGAQVLIEALGVSVGSNAAGHYTLTVPGARVAGQQVELRVRAIGYAPATLRVTISAGSQTHDFQLKEDVNRLSQVVVTGVTAGTEQRKLPFTVASVSAEDMPVPATNPIAALQGKVPGLQMATSSGRPGATMNVQLRTPNSLIGGTSPLYIVDGVLQSQGIGNIDALDIETVEVVKGAAAATMYGSRAANGVIQITTKSGKRGAEGVRINTRFEGGASDIEGKYRPALTNFLSMDPTRTRYCIKSAATSVSTATPGVQDCMQTLDLYDEALRVNEESGTLVMNPQKLLMDGGIALAPAKVNLRGQYQVNLFPKTYDVVRQAMTNGPYANTTVDMQGRYGTSNFFASIANLQQKGSVVFVNGYSRNNFRLNVENTIGGEWTLTAHSYYARTSRFRGGESFFGLTRQPPFVDLLRRDKYDRLFVRSVVTNQGNQNTNPAYSWERANDTEDADRFLGSLSLNWQPLSWVTGTFNFGFDHSTYQQQGQTDIGYRITTNDSPSVPLGDGYRNDGWGQSYNMNLDWTIRRELMTDLAARLVVSTVYEQRDDQDDGQSGEQFVAPGLTTTNALLTNFGIESSTSSQRSMGFVSGLNLEYKGRYILDAAARRDGLSVFGASHRWQTYGKLSAAWRMSEESWWKFSAINDFKLRASRGQAGNTPGASWQYETFNIAAGGVLNPNTLGNKNLAPEVATETEIGFDAEILDRYGLTVSRASTRTTNVILQVTPPAAAGFSSQYKNVATLDGRTWEVSLNVPLIERRDVNWSARFSFDAVHSTVTGLNVPDFFGTNNNSLFFYTKGEPLGRIWGRKLMTSCDELPGAFRPRCGDGLEWQKNDDGMIVWVGPGRTWRDGYTSNAWQAVLPAAQGPYGVEESWGMNITIRDTLSTSSAKPALKTPVGGSTLPDYRWSVAQTASYKNLTAYILVDAVKGRYVYNQEKHWSLGDFAYTAESQLGKSIETAKPIGYYWRAPAPDASGVGGWYDVLGQSNVSTEDGSFVKIREISLSYRLGAVRGVGDWMLTVSGKNLKTFTNYTGFDPDIADGSGVLNANDAYNFPPLRTFTFTISSSW